jgi:sec-independent protein translocase protein TatA
MGGFSLVHWLLFGALVLVLFGKGRISDLMGDVAKGVRSFRKGLTDDDSAQKPEPTPDTPNARLGSNGQPIDVTPNTTYASQNPRDNLRL